MQTPILSLFRLRSNASPHLRSGIFMKRIVLTGGGTAGHVTPNIALMPKLREIGYDIQYIGSYDGIEKKLIEELGVPYYGISSGKLRRYFDMKNFTDPFRVVKGFFQAKSQLKKLKPDIIFSKGGFVSVPVVQAAKQLHIPVIIHESDMTPGLANKLAIPAATKVCCNFPETVPYLPAGKAVVTGSPIRAELRSGNRLTAAKFCNFTFDKPVLLIIGGSLGSVAVNQAIRGKGNLDPSLEDTAGYVQFEYIKQELADLFAFADVVVSRAGANAICELLELRKPNLLIPLSAAASRGDQILNAKSFKKQGFSDVLQEEELTPDVLLSHILALYENRHGYINAMNKSSASNAVNTIVTMIEDIVNAK